MSKNLKKEINEFNIPVPWGFIAVKAWGNPEDTPILVIHGIGDNAGIFDHLIPLLPNNFYYICLDMPGYGRSSPFPRFAPLNETFFMLTYQLIMDYFKQESYTVIAHSLGAQAVFLFSRMYPKSIKKIIAIDFIPFLPIESDNYISYYRQKFDKFYKQYMKEMPSFPYEDILQFTMTARYQGSNLDKASAEAILARCLEPAGDGTYRPTIDMRFNTTLLPLHDIRYAIESLEHDPINCPVLLIIAERNEFPRKMYKAIYDHLQKQKNTTVVYVDGDHDVHTNNPSLIAPHISTFLLTQKSKM